MSFMKSVGTSAKGNDRLLKQYGGNSGSSPMARQHYATGGAVKSKEGNPSLGEGLSAAADGAPSKPSLSRPGRKMPGKGKDAKKGTNVNVVIMQSPAKGGPDAGPMPGGGPPMPPPGAGPGGPPMPMRANGGRISNLGKFAWGGKVKMTTKGDEAGKIAKKETHGAEAYARGGKVKRADGGWTGEGDSGKKLREEAKEVRDEPNMAKGMLGSAAGSGASALALARRKGPGLIGAAAPLAGLAYMGKKAIDSLRADGKAKDLEKKADEAEGRACGGRIGKKEGGPAMGLHIEGKTVGSGGGLGRLAKLKKYGA